MCMIDKILASVMGDVFNLFAHIALYYIAATSRAGTGREQFKKSFNQQIIYFNNKFRPEKQIIE